MNVLEILKADHERVRDLFDQVDQAEELNDRMGLFKDLRQELETHVAIEERLVYPFLGSKAELSELIDDSRDDHQEMKELLQEFERIDDPELWDDRIGELYDVVEDHVEFEEEEVFPRAMELFSAEELDRIGSKIAEIRKESRGGVAAA